LTPLHYAAGNGHLEVYGFILEHLTDKIHEDMYGLTPLHFSAMNGQLEMCKLILEIVENKNPRTSYAVYGK
jgi:ankyrin repeat protein